RGLGGSDQVGQRHLFRDTDEHHRLSSFSHAQRQQVAPVHYLRTVRVEQEFHEQFLPFGRHWKDTLPGGKFQTSVQVINGNVHFFDAAGGFCVLGSSLGSSPERSAPRLA